MNVVDRQADEERRTALRALLMQPLLLANHPHFGLVRRHASWLIGWFDRHPRWALSVKPDCARLRKSPGRLDDATRPARDAKSELAFTRRRYALWCLALAVLEGSERQTTLGTIVRSLESELMAPGLAPLDLESRDDRRNLVHVVRLLVEVGALRRVAGDESDFVQDRGRDALYNVVFPVLGALLDVRVPPSLVQEADPIAAITRETVGDTDAARNQVRRTTLMRLLLDDPVVYYADLAPDLRAYLATQRPFLVKEIAAATGLVEEARAEGLAMVDPEDELTDLRMPEEGSEGHLALLVAEWVAGRGSAVGMAEVEAKVRQLSDDNQKYWAKPTREPGADVRYAAQTLERLEALGLIRRDGDVVCGQPALARFRAVAVVRATSPGLFDEVG